MSLRGIDAQIMVTKALDLTADRAKQLKLDALNADQAAEQGKRRIRHEQKRTQGAANAERNGIHRDEHKGGPGRGQTEEEHPDGETFEEEDETTALLELPVERGEKTRQKTCTFDAVI
ncbi:MAG: hypothetical protein LBT60_07620 [Oscillospiraceae bacterium]|jgi:hypothetical protein|nr:hypothetical protein [Oscillospiraceae bacterium]